MVDPTHEGQTPTNLDTQLSVANEGPSEAFAKKLLQIGAIRPLLRQSHTVGGSSSSSWHAPFGGSFKGNHKLKTTHLGPPQGPTLKRTSHPDLFLSPIFVNFWSVLDGKNAAPRNLKSAAPKTSPSMDSTPHRKKKRVSPTLWAFQRNFTFIIVDHGWKDSDWHP